MIKVTVIGSTEEIAVKKFNVSVVQTSIASPIFDSTSSKDDTDKPKKVFSVSSFPGVKVKTFELDRSVIQHQYGELANEVIDIVESFSPDNIDLHMVEKFGLALQKEYSEKLQKALSLISSNEVRVTQRHLDRLTQLLLESSEYIEEGFGFFKTEKKFETIKKEITELNTIFDSCADRLVCIRVELKELLSDFLKFSKSAKAYMISSDILVDLVHEEYKDSMLSRGMSLSHTVTQINDQVAITESFLSSLASLTEKTRTLINKHIPDFLVLTCKFESGISETQKYVIKDGVQTIIQFVKP